MRRDRLATVLELRELVERQRLVERAAAAREHASAVEALGAACELRADAVVEPGTSMVASQLSAHRVQSIALGDAVDQLEVEVRATARESELAGQRLVAAAVRRRGVERLRDRRAAVAARATGRRDARRLDEVALQVWRRSS